MNGVYPAKHLLGQPQADFGLPQFMTIASCVCQYAGTNAFLHGDLDKQSLI